MTENQQSKQRLPDDLLDELVRSISHRIMLCVCHHPVTSMTQRILADIICEGLSQIESENARLRKLETELELWRDGNIVRKEDHEERARLWEAVKSLLDASWNGPLDADHPARKKAADILANAL